MHGQKQNSQLVNFNRRYLGGEGGGGGGNKIAWSFDVLTVMWSFRPWGSLSSGSGRLLVPGLGGPGFLTCFFGIFLSCPLQCPIQNSIDTIKAHLKVYTSFRKKSFLYWVISLGFQSVFACLFSLISLIFSENEKWLPVYTSLYICTGLDIYRVNEKDYD